MNSAVLRMDAVYPDHLAAQVAPVIDMKIVAKACAEIQCGLMGQPEDIAGIGVSLTLNAMEGCVLENPTPCVADPAGGRGIVQMGGPVRLGWAVVFVSLIVDFKGVQVKVAATNKAAIAWLEDVVAIPVEVANPVKMVDASELMRPVKPHTIAR